jgi:hypothetical protein
VRVRDWWCRKYNRPPNDPFFTDQSVPEITLEMFEDLLLKRQALQDSLEQEEFVGREGAERYERTRQKINEISRVFGEDEQVQDDLVDKWEREIAEGRTPDLDE